MSLSKSPIGEFGWDGAAGAYVLIDEKNKLAIIYLQHIMNCSYVYDVIHPRIRDLTYEAIAGEKEGAQKQ
jgi:CubicO group peptidase (beta-lactamase class C family)